MKRNEIITIITLTVVLLTIILGIVLIVKTERERNKGINIVSIEEVGGQNDINKDIRDNNISIHNVEQSDNRDNNDSSMPNRIRYYKRNKVRIKKGGSINEKIHIIFDKVATQYANISLSIVYVTYK